MAADDQPISVTVVGGYLGAGKTTLLNHLLASVPAGGPSGDDVVRERIAVLVNDFGDINIDAELITGNDGTTIELANGCICCSLVDGLATALETIERYVPRPDRMIIEASGVADPATVAAYAHGPGLLLDSVVVVVDGETIISTSTDKYVGDTVVHQLASADLVVLNKVDLMTPHAVTETAAWLAERCPTAVVIETARAVVDRAVLFAPDLATDERTSFGEEPSVADATSLGAVASVAGASAAETAHAHFATWSWTSDQPVARSTIEGLMAALPSSVLRLKGIVALDDDARPHLVQRVGGRWSLRVLPGSGTTRSAGERTTTGAQPSSAGRSRLVAIGLPGAIDERWLARRMAPPPL